MSIDHYENFPVASALLPAKLRGPVQAIYAFARSADDLADEGDAAPAIRLAALCAYEAELDKIQHCQSSEHKLFQQLAATVHQYDLPLQALRDLLSAFKQDVVVARYADFDSLLDYCRRSANPVGTLMLQLYDAATEQNLRDSDAICTALQLINFWQDVAIDRQKDRIYLPQEDLRRYGVSEERLDRMRGGAQVDAAWHALMQFEITRTRVMMLSGAPLATRLPGRIGWELRLVIQGGLRILEKIEAVDYDVFRRRPTLQRADWPRLLWRGLTMRSPPKIRLSAGT